MPNSTLFRFRRAIKDGRFLSAARNRTTPYFDGATAVFRRRELAVDVPEEIAPDEHSREISDRVFRAYRRAKDDQQVADRVFAPSEAWQEILDRGYQSLSNVESAHHFFANFGIWPLSLGFDGNTLFRAAARSTLVRAHLEYSYFGKALSFWQWFHGERRPIKSLNSPRFGNQPGALHKDGWFLDVNCFHNEIRGSILAGLVQGMARPVIADLGGGSGKTAEFMLRQLGPDAKWTYLDFDLPETLAIASYFLLSCYPQRKALLYGEGTLNANALESYDLILWPSFTLPRLQVGQPIDLFINRVSLGEMASATTFAYIEQIMRLTRRFFFHMNLDGKRSPYAYENGKERGPLAYEYPIEDTFRLLFRYPDLGHLLPQGHFDLSQEVFMHLYERKTTLS